MNPTLPIWFFETNIAIGIWYLFYRLLLHHDTFFSGKRLAFIGSSVFILIYPFLNTSSWIQTDTLTTKMAARLMANLPEITVNARTENQSGIIPYLVVAYLSVAIIRSIKVLQQIVSVLYLRRKGWLERRNGQNIIHLSNASTPFSFFHWIFVNPDLYDPVNLEEILRHEKTHVKQGHTFDILFAETLCIIFWINPCIWLLKHHQRENLEYLADRGVIRTGFDRRRYQYHLLNLTIEQAPPPISNHFNVSHLKKRITMMNKKKNTPAEIGKYALILPIFGLLLLSANAQNNKKNASAENAEPSEITDAASSNAKGIVDKTINPTITLAANAEKSSQKSEKPRIKESEKPIEEIEEMPEFPGGEKALMEYISNQLHYPESAAKKGIQGKSIIRFVVSKTGSIKHIEILRSLDPACDEEAIRVIRSMPKWKPGKDKGKEVNVFFTLPIRFKLQESPNFNNKPDSTMN